MCWRLAVGVTAGRVIVSNHPAPAGAGSSRRNRPRVPRPLFVETRRHVPYLDELTDTEAAAVGWAAARVAAALRGALDREYVFAATPVTVNGG